MKCFSRQCWFKRSYSSLLEEEVIFVLLFWKLSGCCLVNKIKNIYYTQKQPVWRAKEGAHLMKFYLQTPGYHLLIM